MQSSDDGFTLMETLVALVLLALAAGAFYQGIELGTRGARIAERDADALTVAESRINEAVALGPREELLKGETPDGFAWQTTFTNHNVPTPDNTNASNFNEQPPLVRIDVRVTWRDTPGRPVRDLTLTTFAPRQP